MISSLSHNKYALGMRMWRTFGHDKAKRILQAGIAEGRIAHAYMLSGPIGVGKMTLAQDFSRALNCVSLEKPCDTCNQCSRIDRDVHTDIHVIRVSEGVKDGRRRVLIGIEQIRDVFRELSLKPYEGKFRVVIVDGAEHFSGEAANSLLKTLEEPPDQVVIVLLTADHNIVLPTVVSRCQLLEMRPLNESVIIEVLQTEHGVQLDKANEIARLSQGMVGWALRATQEPGLIEDLMNRIDVVAEVVGGDIEHRFSYANDLAVTFTRDRWNVRRELDLWLAWWRDVLLVKYELLKLVVNSTRADFLKRISEFLTIEQIIGVLGSIEDTKRVLDRNANPRLALDNLMLSLPKLS